MERPQLEPVHTSISPARRRVASAIRLKKRSMREKDGRFLVEGTRVVGEAIASGAHVTEVFHVPGGFNYPRARADRCYLDPAAAEADGLRASKR